MAAVRVGPTSRIRQAAQALGSIGFNFLDEKGEAEGTLVVKTLLKALVSEASGTPEKH